MFIQGLAGVGYSWQTVGNEIAQGRLRLIVPGFERAECFDFVSYKGLLSESEKGLSSQGHGFSSGHVWMCELDCEES